MIKYSFESTGRRPLEEIKGLTVFECGGANSFANDYLTGILDIRYPQASAPNIWTGDMNDPDTWIPILKYVDREGKFDYSICTHTLEDLANPIFVSKMLEKVSKKGLIIVPSKHRELARFEGDYRGFRHHRWIFDIHDNQILAFPKSAYLEEKRFDEVHKCLPAKEELIVEWEDTIGMKEIFINEWAAGIDKDANVYYIEQYDLLLK